MPASLVPSYLVSSLDAKPPPLPSSESEAVQDSGWLSQDKMLDVELDQDLLLSFLFAGVLEWEQDGEYPGEPDTAEQAEPAREAALLGLQFSRMALPAIGMSFGVNKLVAQVLPSKRLSPSPVVLQVWKV